MKKVKYYLIPLITSFLMFSNCLPVHAEGYYTLIDFKEDTEEYITGGGLAYDATSALKNWVHRGFQSVGFLINEVQDTLGIKRAINQVDSTIDDNSSDEDVNEWIRNNITVSGNNVEFSNDLRQSMNNYADTYITENQSFCYSYPLLLNSNQFGSIEQYNKAANIIKNNNGVYAVVTPSSGINYIAYYDMGKNHPYRVFKETSANTGRDYGINVNIYDGGTNSVPQPDAYWKWDRPDPTNNPTVYDWIAPDTIPSVNLPSIWICLKPNYTKPFGLGRSYSIFCNNPKSVEYRLFKHGKAVTNDSILYQPYYLNEDTWNDFSSTSGDYTVTGDNINTVSYGDTIEYINSFNTENGYPPTPADININIENKNDENNNPSGGGGSGDDSGGGSGGSGDGIGSIGDIFGFLKQLGTVIASLIKGLGDFVAEIVGGLAEAVGSLIESISSLITNLHSSMSSAFFDIIGDLFEWMPTEWKDLMTYAFTIMILIAVIKFIRG